MKTERNPSAAVLQEWQVLLEGAVCACHQQRVWQRLLVASLGLLSALGRRTLSQVIVTIGWGDADWTAWYRLLNRKRVDWEELQQQVAAAVSRDLPAGAPFAVAVDATHLPRTSRRMPGVGWARQPRTPVWRPGIHRAQRWVGLNALLPLSASGDSRAVPLRWVPACPPAAQPVQGYPPMTEWQAGLSLLYWLRTTLDRQGLAERVVLAVGDGAYANAQLWNGLPQRTILLARCAKNRALFGLPDGAHHGRGRKPRYGARLPVPPDFLVPQRAFQTVPIVVRGRTLNLRVRVIGPVLVKPAPDHPLFLLVVKGVDRGKGQLRRFREPSYLLVNAFPTADGQGWTLPLSVADLLSWAWQRWEVEVMHRELKSGFGLGQQQQWSDIGVVSAVHWVTWLYATVLLAGYRAWGYHPPPEPTLGRWWRPRRWSTATLWQAIRQEVWQLAEFQPVWARSPDKWHEMQTWFAAPDNVLNGYRRI